MGLETSFWLVLHLQHRNYCCTRLYIEYQLPACCIPMVPCALPTWGYMATSLYHMPSQLGATWLPPTTLPVLIVTWYVSHSWWPDIWFVVWNTPVRRCQTKMCLGPHCAELCVALVLSHLWTQILQFFLGQRQWVWRVTWSASRPKLN